MTYASRLIVILSALALFVGGCGDNPPSDNPPVSDDASDGQTDTDALPDTDSIDGDGDEELIDSETTDGNPTGVTIDKGPSNETYSTSATFEMTCDEVPCEIECRLDSNPWRSCQSVEDLANIEQGDHVFEARARTGTSGEYGDSAEWGWTVNGVSVTILTGPDGLVNQTAATFGFSCNAPNCNFECKLDDSAWAACPNPYSVTASSEGPHKLEVRARTTDGPWSAVKSWNWTLDTEALVVNVTEQPARYTTEQDATVVFECSKANCTLECRENGGAFAGCLSPKRYTGLAEADHLLEIRGTDRAGNESPIKSVEWTVDLSETNVTNLSGPADSVANTDAAFSFDCDNEPCTYECQLDEGDKATCYSGKSYLELSEGEHTFSVTATGRNGTVSSAETRTWTVDTIAPTLEVTQQPETPTKETTVNISVTCSEQPCVITCSLDGGTFERCESPMIYSDLDDGEHIVRFRGTDAAGNIAIGGPVNWEQDTEAPQVVGVGAPASPTQDARAWPAWGCSELNCSYFCSLDEGPIFACESGVAPRPSSQGRHRLAIYAEDEIGNRGEPSYGGWRVDRIAPIVRIVSKPPLLANTDSAIFEFTIDESSSPYECKHISPAGGNNDFEPCDTPWSLTGLSEGVHEIVVRATDEAGNQSNEKSYSWTVDTIPPGITADAPAEAFVGQNFNLAFANTDDAVRCDYRVNSGPWIRSDNCQPRFRSFATAGIVTWRVRGYDQAGNIDDTSETTVDIIAVEWKSVSAGYRNTCAILDHRGQLYCWGDNFEDQLGQGEAADNIFETAVPLLVGEDFSEVSVGDAHVCAIKNDRSLWCWGDNLFGAVGVIEAGDNASEPTQVEDWTWKSVAAGDDFTCAIRDSGRGILYCWGLDNKGQLGRSGTSFTRMTPTRASSLVGGWDYVVAGEEHACAVSDSNDLYCWGSSSHRQVGNGEEVATVQTPVEISAGTVAVSLGLRHTCSIESTSKRTSCWGDNSNFAYGTNSASSSTPKLVSFDPRRDLAAGGYHTCAISNNDRSLSCWGANYTCQTGQSDCDGTTDSPAEVHFDSGLSGRWKDLDAGTYHTCAITTSDELFCWGFNESEQLARPDSILESANLDEAIQPYDWR